jgi:hypothetical protein
MSVPCRAALTVGALCCYLLAQAQEPDPRVDPRSALWAGIKKQLTGPDGEQYFESNLKGTALPSMRGTVVRVSAPNAVLLNLSGGTTPEVMLLLNAGQKLPQEADDIFFGQAEPVAFTREPFLLTMQAAEEAAPGPQSDCPQKFVVEKSYGPPLGIVLNGRYHHHLTGIEFVLPPGWCVLGTSPSTSNGETALLYNSDFSNADASVWMIRERTPLANISDQLQAAIPEKLKERAGFAKYTIRPGSVDSTWIGGRQALRAIADYEEKGRAMSESLTWIYTERTRAFFFARAEAEEMPAFQTHFDQIIYSANIP